MQNQRHGEQSRRHDGGAGLGQTLAAFALSHNGQALGEGGGAETGGFGCA
jgi:hypothetical protein